MHHLHTLDAVITVAELERAVIQAEHATGQTPAGLTRPLFPWERHTDFADMDRTITTGYAETASILIQLRDQLAVLIGHNLTDDELLALLLRPPAEVRDLLEQAARMIGRTLHTVQAAEAKRMIRDAVRQGVRPQGAPEVFPAGVWRSKGRLIAVSLWAHITEAAVNAQRDTTPITARDAAELVSIKAAQDQARQSVHTASAAGITSATQVLEEPKARYASELLDRFTCEPCSAVDGKPYDSDVDAAEDYPHNGGYANCSGRDRCRGTLVLVWDEADPTIDDLPAWPRQ